MNLFDDLAHPEAAERLAEGAVVLRGSPSHRVPLAAVTRRALHEPHLLPTGVEPGLEVSWDARDAGYTPKITPTPAPSARATSTDQVVTRAGSGDAAEMKRANTQPLAAPSAPPNVASMTDSTRNCVRMSRRRAPTDFRSPISCVRCATE